MGLLDLIMLYKISEMEDKIDQLQNQLHPSETPETKEDIEEWLNERDKEAVE